MQNEQRLGAATDLWAVIIIGLLAIIGPIVVSIISENLMSSSQMLSGLVDVVAWFVPGIDRVAVLSDFPELTRVSLSIFWVLLPLHIFLLSKLTRDPELISASMRSHKWLFAFAMLLFIAIIYSVLAGSGVDTEALSRRGPWANLLRLATTSQVALGVLGALLPFVVAIGIYVVLAWAKRIPELYLSK